MGVPVITNADARRIFLARHGLAARPAGPGKTADLKAVIDGLGFVQLDSVNTFARAHDLILWSRRTNYRPAALQNLLARDRQLFEHWTHDAAIMPIESFAHWRLRFARDATRMESRWKDWRRGDFMAKTDAVLRQIADHGPVTSADVGTDERRGTGGWWDWHPSKTALEYLWRAGQLSVLRREGFRKVYDLTERVIPPEHLNRRFTAAETIDWCCAGALDRLGFATHGELAAFWDHLSPDETKAWCAAALAAGRIIAVDVEAADGRLRRHVAPADLPDAALPEVTPRLRILSPFDPALRDRKRAARLFGFDYRIEIFVPAAKRRYGYYVFPVLQGTRLIGRIDMKRDGATLAVRAFWPERGIAMGKGRTEALKSALASAARFGGCGDLSFEDDWLRPGGGA